MLVRSLSYLKCKTYFSSALLIFNKRQANFKPYASASLLSTKTSHFQTNYANKNIDQKIFLFDKYSKFTFEQLIQLSTALRSDLLRCLDVNDLGGKKIGVFCNNNYTYLISILAIWQANGVPFCLNKQYPNSFIEYFLNDSKCELVINGMNVADEAHDRETALTFDAMLKQKNVVNFELAENEYHQQNCAKVSQEKRSLTDLVKFLGGNEQKSKESLLLYTSGTSGPPKGCLITFYNLLSSIESMIEAYKWNENDCVLSTLPLNHFSGYNCVWLP